MRVNPVIFLDETTVESGDIRESSNLKVKTASIDVNDLDWSEVVVFTDILHKMDVVLPLRRIHSRIVNIEVT